MGARFFNRVHNQGTLFLQALQFGFQLAEAFFEHRNLVSRSHVACPLPVSVKNFTPAAPVREATRTLI
jgi:hypothetical protein